MKGPQLYKFPRKIGMHTNFFHLIELAKRFDVNNPPGKEKIQKLKDWFNK